MKNSVDTSFNSLGQLLIKCLRHSFALLFVTAVLVSIIMITGLWYNNEYATNAIVSGVQPPILFGLVAFVLVIPLADLFGSVCKLSYLFIRKMLDNLSVKKIYTVKSNSSVRQFEIVPILE